MSINVFGSSSLGSQSSNAFVCYELVALGLVKEETMDMLNNKFDKMDEQGDGFISFDEAMKKGYLFENKDTKKVL